MKRLLGSALGVVLATLLSAAGLRAEILAMVNYESKSPNLGGPKERREGLMVLDVDPGSPTFGKILMDIPLPPDFHSHHIFYDKTMTKAYVTAFGKDVLHVMDMRRFPYRLKKIDVSGCEIGEDVVFSDDNKTWYLTCMGSRNVVVGDVAADKVKGEIPLPKTYPHGIAVHNGIDRMLVTSTVRHTDLKDAGETLAVIQASTSKVLTPLKVSRKPSPSREAPVEVLFRPGSNPPVAFTTNMYGASLWAATWNPAKKGFVVKEAFDFAKIAAGVPLELYFNNRRDRLYVTTAKPGQFHIFDVSQDPASPKFLKTLPAAEGAHHVAFTKDERYAFVQNSLLNLPGLSDGSITVVDLQKEEVVTTVDTLKNMGLNPNCIVLLPEWNHLAGH
ncbi:MAG: YncE family protein [Candidatus Tectomicrobia bacterium]|nr:YncE family protein [Candidatus Tectomicrobia bacterium]